uniref:Uncharacterized protein n=1 Tax=Picea glauca TaxID=3330 RepID=A0A101LXW7_PICGL|nr:hypothetical protein ABT39_MTgene5552 [Picea glauca]
MSSGGQFEGACSHTALGPGNCESASGERFILTYDLLQSYRDLFLIPAKECVLQFRVKTKGDVTCL